MSWDAVDLRESAAVFPGRLGHSASAYKSTVVIVGGRDSKVHLNDVLSFDVGTRRLTRLLSAAPFSPRAYHSATVIDDELWLVGGSDPSAVFGDVWVMDLVTREWRAVKLRGPAALLRRTAHAAIAHPTRPGCILLHGGFGSPPPPSPMAAEDAYLGDAVVIHTASRVVASLSLSGPAPAPRAYHTMTALGHRLYLFGGKGDGPGGGAPAQASERLAVVDVSESKWLRPPLITGAPPRPRFSHRAVRLIAPPPLPMGCGAVVIVAGASPAELPGEGGRFGDAVTLLVLPARTPGEDYHYQWRRDDDGLPVCGGFPGPQIPPQIPPRLIPRSAHTLTEVQGAIVLVGGYAGKDKARGAPPPHLADIYVLSRPPSAAVLASEAARAATVAPGAAHVTLAVVAVTAGWQKTGETREGAKRRRAAVAAPAEAEAALPPASEVGEAPAAPSDDIDDVGEAVRSTAAGGAPLSVGLGNPPCPTGVVGTSPGVAKPPLPAGPSPMVIQAGGEATANALAAAVDAAAKAKAREAAASREAKALRLELQRAAANISSLEGMWGAAVDDASAATKRAAIAESSAAAAATALDSERRALATCTAEAVAERSRWAEDAARKEAEASALRADLGRARELHDREAAAARAAGVLRQQQLEAAGAAADAERARAVAAECRASAAEAAAAAAGIRAEEAGRVTAAARADAEAQARAATARLAESAAAAAAAQRDSADLDRQLMETRHRLDLATGDCQRLREELARERADHTRAADRAGRIADAAHKAAAILAAATAQARS